MPLDDALWRLDLDVPAPALDAATAAAEALGAQGVAIIDADTGAPPDRAIVQSWHPPDADPHALAAAARARLAACADARVTLTREATHWRAALDPAPLTVAGFTIGPALDPGPRALRLDPASAFGGDHPTTALCLEALTALCAERPPARALDVGTGTGVLALALARLGAGHVVATDIDPLARAAAARHAAANGLQDRVTVHAALPDARYDLIVANLYLGPLLALAPALITRLAPGAPLVLSGVAPRHQPALAAAYPLTPRATRERDGWLAWIVASPPTEEAPR
ncbi:MAG: 50S ribosomal protein L11 methyltransferase [Myxococcales bacterium]|nr:50S ribosomal protein L11 methyltransferase [Myxococcales bacterium]